MEIFNKKSKMGRGKMVRCMSKILDIYVIEIKKKGKIYLNIKPNDAHTYAEAVI